MYRCALALLLPCVSAFAQPRNIYVPNSDATTGICNSIPFNQSSSLYQTVVDAADLGNRPQVITGIGFAACGSGVHSYGTMEVVMDHTQAATLSTTFAQNLTVNAQTVLQVTDHDWHVVQDTWNELGLQRPFVYNGVDRLVIQITFQNHSFQGTTGSGSFHRDTRQRVYSNNWGTLPVTGSNSNAAIKLELSVLTARASVFGTGCRGSAGVPTSSYSGTPQLGQANSFDLANAPANSVCFLVTGSANGAPFPQDLGAVGAPGCRQYFGIDATYVAVSDAMGSATVPVTVPNQPTLLGALVYGQWACLDAPANTVGITTSDYVRVSVGN